MEKTTHSKTLADGERCLCCHNNPTLNKGTAFTMRERKEHSLRGLFPPSVEALSLQAERVMKQIREESGPDLDKYSILQQLSVTNQTLFYKVLCDNVVELLPIVYTPTVGAACINFDRIYRASIGMYFSAELDKGEFRDILDNWPHPEVKIIVITDGGRILGLGDLGTNGMGISIGKISLYVAGAGFHPKHSLPVCLDVGTNRKELLEDRFYLGSKTPRLQGEEHMEVVEEFCMAVKDKWPHCLIQFEDFKTDRAFAILERMRDKVLCFNDDIQGTGSVVLAGFINGMKAQKADLKHSKVVFYGAGSSACGVAGMIVELLQSEGLSRKEALKAIYMVDTKGLITNTRGDKLAPHKVPFARTDGAPDMKELCAIIEYVKPYALFGLSGGGTAFDKPIVRKLCDGCDRPLIFPLSNPTSKAEITATDAYTFSDGKCIFAAGSPFDPVEYNGRTYYPGQGNNVFIFPGVGFGAVLAKAKKIPDTFFIEAAKELADFVTTEEINAGKIYPSLKDLRNISLNIAVRVVNTAFDMDLAEIERPDDVTEFVKSAMYNPHY
mmetsp:Transcript_1649/g.2364  ORF Transcript_1649/g.2364 Transcript_1649/m.2364 type:complete len:553 (-) Transcript_1649:1118-2776(-)